MKQYVWLRNGVYTLVKTSPVEKFKNGWKNDMVANTTTHLLGEFSRDQVNPRVEKYML